MLSLKNDQSKSEDKPPNYIQLSIGHNLIGRGYKADVKLLKYPWLSRKHLNITRVDDSHYLEAFGKNAVFVNGRSVTFSVLAEGDRVIIGGANNNYPVGSPFPDNPSPYIEYSYSYSKKIEDKENCYKEPIISPHELIYLEEQVNGRIVEETYHLQDFETTLDNFDVDLQATVLSNITNSAEADTCIMPPKRPVRCKKPKKHSDMIYECEKKSKKSSHNNATKTEQQTEEEKLAPVIKGIEDSKDSFFSKVIETKVLPSCSNEDASVQSKANKKRTRPASSKSTKAGATGKSVGKKKGRNKASSTVSRPEDLLNDDGDDDAWAQFQRAANIVDNTVALIDKKLKDKESITDKSNAAVAVAGENVEVQQKLTVNNLTIKPIFESPSKQKRPKRLSKLLVNYNYSEGDTSGSNSPKKGMKRKRLLPDKEYVPGEEDIFNEDDADTELPDIVASHCNDVAEFMETEKRGKRKSDESYDEPAKKKPNISRKGKGKGKKSVKVQEVRNREQQLLLEQWSRGLTQATPSKYVEVLNGRHRRYLYSFQDNNLFKVKYLNEKPGESSQHHWDSDEYNVQVKIDMPKLRNKLLSGALSENDLNRVFRIVKKQMKKPKMSDFDKPRMAPPDYIIHQSDLIHLELKQYQLDTMGWMKRLEDRVERGFTATKLVHWDQSGIDLGFDVVNKRVFEPPLPLSNNTVLSVKSKGGILADQMGLGKTITLLGLISMNRATFPKIPDPVEFNYQENFHLPTGATLVVAPSHLTGQWKDEVESHTHGLKVIVITTKVQYEKIMYVDILEADIVVVSVQFLLSNKVFTSLATGVNCETGFMEFMRKPEINPLKEKGPNLMHFNWWRIIADEAHEIMTYDLKHVKQTKVKGTNVNLGSQGLQTLDKFQSRYRWYVTGTPFPHGKKSLRAALKFLKVKVDDPTLEYPDGSLQVDQGETFHEDYTDQALFLYPLHSIVYNHLYVRNTKGSIGKDYDVPEYMEELILLTMGEVERGIYERAVNELERRQLCCHLQIAARIQHVAGVQQKTLDEVRVALVEQAKKDIKLTKRMIDTTKEDIKTAKKEKNELFDPTQKNIVQSRIKRMEENVKRYDEEIVKHNSALSYFESIVPRIDHSADEPCVICLESITNLTVTPCGHMYCRKCILQCLHAQGQCPTCRQRVHENQLIEVQDAQARDELAKSTELKQLTEKYGTKMAYLIFYLRNLFQADDGSRVIIFSQWDSLLHKIGETLNENAIKNVFVKGNVHVRNKAIMSFRKQQKTRVIMLSLQNAASGTNLVEATHVILIDPIAGTPEEAIAIESQAIGRAHRMGQNKQISVVRMIMKDTIEHELYKRNDTDDSIQQVEFDFEQKSSFGGPQIVKRTRTVPEPDPAILQQALNRQEEEALTFVSGNNRGRNRRGWGDLEQLRRLQSIADSLHNYQSDDAYSDSDDSSDYDDDEGMWQRRRIDDCVIS